MLILLFFFFYFFFSSRRRHTRWHCDWSSDVCSSDLATWTTGSTEIDRKTRRCPSSSCLESCKSGNTVCPLWRKASSVPPRNTSQTPSQHCLGRDRKSVV